MFPFVATASFLAKFTLRPHQRARTGALGLLKRSGDSTAQHPTSVPDDIRSVANHFQADETDSDQTWPEPPSDDERDEGEHLYRDIKLSNDPGLADDEGEQAGTKSPKRGGRSPKRAVAP